MPRIPTPEAGVLKACTDLLTAERIWWMRMNTGAMKDGKRFIRFGRPGTADVLAMLRVPGDLWELGEWHHQPLWIEAKSSMGRQSCHQVAFQKEVLEAGHHYLIVRKPEELLTWLREHGVISAS